MAIPYDNSRNLILAYEDNSLKVVCSFDSSVNGGMSVYSLGELYYNDNTDVYSLEHTFPDGAIFSFSAYGHNHSQADFVGSYISSYNASSSSSYQFKISPSALSYLNSFFSSGGSSGDTVDLSALNEKFDGFYSRLSALQLGLTDILNTRFDVVYSRIEGLNEKISDIDLSDIDLSNIDLTPILNSITPLSSKIDGLGKYNLLDLNGQYGSYRKGTKVLIEGKVEEYEVLSSSLIWSSYAGALVISYNLKNLKGEICPCTHPFLSLAPVPATTPTSSQGS